MLTVLIKKLLLCFVFWKENYIHKFSVHKTFKIELQILLKTKFIMQRRRKKKYCHVIFMEEKKSFTTKVSRTILFSKKIKKKLIPLFITQAIKIKLA
jgi:hypothetical protein